MGCVSSAPQDVDAAAEEVVTEEMVEPESKKQLGDLLRTGAIRLVKLKWLKEHFVDKKEPLIRRQDMPEAAFASKDEALKAIDMVEVGILSHGWLGRDHPDPHGHRRAEIRKMTVFPAKYVFLDFVSLFQKPRTEEQDQLFRQALGSMHLIYSNHKWPVFRMIVVPKAAENQTPYEDRGWCLFETCVSATGASSVHTLKGGERTDYNMVTPVPKKPDVFNEEIKTKQFTNGADADTVIDLYKRIWPTIVSKSTPLQTYNWEDAQAEEFLAVLPELTGLQIVYLFFWHGSNEMKTQLSEAMQERGGFCILKTKLQA